MLLAHAYQVDLTHDDRPTLQVARCREHRANDCFRRNAVKPRYGTRSRRRDSMAVLSDVNDHGAAPGDPPGGVARRDVVVTGCSTGWDSHDRHRGCVWHARHL